MEYRTLGRTGLQISLLGMGTGGHNCLGQTTDPPRPREEIVRFLRQVFDLGVNLFDTAPAYMDSEAILGQALVELPRDEVVISTKVGLASYGPDREVVVATPEGIEASVEASLRRLQVEALDLVLVSVLAHNMLNQSAQQTVLPTCVERNVGAMNIFTVRNVFRDPPRLAEVVADLKGRGVLPADLDESDPFAWLLADVDSLVEAAYRFAAFAPGVSTVMCGTIALDKVAADIGYLEKGPLAESTKRSGTRCRQRIVSGHLAARQNPFALVPHQRL